MRHFSKNYRVEKNDVEMLLDKVTQVQIKIRVI